MAQFSENWEQRVSLIKQIQTLVWECELIDSDQRFENALGTFALDLDYYDPDEIVRTEDASFYGDERLKREIELFLDEINRLKQSV